MINKYVLNPVFKKIKADSIYNKLLDNINSQTNFIRNGESVMAINLDNVRKKKDIWSQNMNPIKPYFAVKSFPEPKICNEFTYFDCASAGEIKMIQDLGYSEQESRVIKAGLYSYTKDKHPELSNYERAIKMKSYATQQHIANLDINAIKQAIETHFANKKKDTDKKNTDKKDTDKSIL